MKVQAILKAKSPDVITATPDQSLHEASQTLAQHNIGVLVVVNQSDFPVGIVSERDIVRELAESRESCLVKTIADIMTEEVIIALPDDDLNHVSNVMTNNRIRHLPIVKGNQLVGIISIGDVVKAQLKHFEGEAMTLMNYITGGHA